MKTVQHSLIPLFALAATLALGGCSREKAEHSDAAADSAAQDVAQSAEEAPPTPPQPKVDYWKPIAPYLAGNYNGPCMHVTGGSVERKNATASLATDGKYKFNGHTGDLLNSEVLAINRSPDEDGAMRLMLSANSEDTVFGLSTGAGGKGSAVTFGTRDGGTFTCEHSTQPLPLVDKPLHIVFASFLERPSGTIKCVSSDSILGSAVEFQVKNGVLKIGKYTYNFAGMNETLTINDRFGSLLYLASKGNGETISVALDQSGAVDQVMRQHEKDGLMMCTNKT